MKIQACIIRLFLPAVCIIGIFIGCERLGRFLNPCSEDRFIYTAFDSTGTIAASGWLTLELNADKTVSGIWKISAAGSATVSGPQDGSGDLAGGYSGDSVWVDLQPHMMDNNLLLRGRLRDGLYAGSWEYIGFTGPVAGGPFCAIK